jgi:hypothetical protein
MQELDARSISVALGVHVQLLCPLFELAVSFLKQKQLPQERQAACIRLLTA